MGFPERVTNYREEVDGKVEEEKTDYKTLCNRGTTCFMFQKNLNCPVIFHATRSWTHYDHWY